MTTYQFFIIFKRGIDQHHRLETQPITKLNKINLLYQPACSAVDCFWETFSFLLSFLSNFACSDVRPLSPAPDVDTEAMFQMNRLHQSLFTKHHVKICLVCILSH